MRRNESRWSFSDQASVRLFRSEGQTTQDHRTREPLRTRKLTLWRAVSGLWLIVLIFGVGCRSESPTISPSSTPPSETAPSLNAPSAPSETGPAASKTPIKDALETLFAQEAASETPVFPKGTRLLSVNVQDGVATVDLSREFNDLESLGESVAAEAQRKLRRALARFAKLEKLRVTVEGKPFESQVTDWDTPFPIRGADLDAEARQDSLATGASHS